MFERDAKYTLPLTTTGGEPFEKLYVSSPTPELDQRRGRDAPLFCALKAYRAPGTTAWLASPARGVVAQRMPVPDAVPLAEIVIIPPGMPGGGRIDPSAKAGSLSLWVEVLKRKARRKSFSPQA